jgi:hypothetical protein
VLAVLEDLAAVDEDVDHTGGVLVRIGEGGMILDCGWVKDHDIGVVAGREAATPVQLKVGGGQRGQPTDRLLQRDEPFVTHILAQEPGKGPVGAGVGTGPEKDALRSL